MIHDHLAAKYAHACLAGAGFALLRSDYAWKLRPDLWPTPMECATTKFVTSGRVDGAHYLALTIEDEPMLVPCVCWNADQLADRVFSVLGLRVREVKPYTEPAPTTRDPNQLLSEAQQRSGRAKLERQQRLAGQALPTWDCHLRDEILKARKALAGAENAGPEQAS